MLVLVLVVLVLVVLVRLVVVLVIVHPRGEGDPDQEPFRAQQARRRLAPGLLMRVSQEAVSGRLQLGGAFANGLTAVLVKRLGVRPAGWKEALPDYPTLGDVDSAQALADYQAKKRAYKATLRESGGTFDPSARRADTKGTTSPRR